VADEGAGCMGTRPGTVQARIPRVLASRHSVITSQNEDRRDVRGRCPIESATELETSATHFEPRLAALTCGHAPHPHDSRMMSSVSKSWWEADELRFRTMDTAASAIAWIGCRATVSGGQQYSDSDVPS
jgi:hypothetical protein